MIGGWEPFCYEFSDVYGSFLNQDHDTLSSRPGLILSVICSHHLSWCCNITNLSSYPRRSHKQWQRWAHTLFLPSHRHCHLPQQILLKCPKSPTSPGELVMPSSFLSHLCILLSSSFAASSQIDPMGPWIKKTSHSYPFWEHLAQHLTHKMYSINAGWQCTSHASAFC